jgi:hypothetical protein
MKRFEKLVYLSVIGTAALLTGCGGQSYQTQTPYTVSPNSTSSTSTGTTSSSTVPITTAATDTTKDTTTNANGYPLITSDFQVYGNRGIASANITPGNYRQFQITDIGTDNLLRVSVSATSPGLITETGYQIPFYCAKFSVKVGDTTQTAFVSTVGDSPTGVCAGATSSPILKFDSLAKAGHGNFTVTITPTLYDNCNQTFDTWYQMGTFWRAGCTLNTIYNTHLISGTAIVYVNGAAGT